MVWFFFLRDTIQENIPIIQHMHEKVEWHYWKNGKITEVDFKLQITKLHNSNYKKLISDPRKLLKVVWPQNIKNFLSYGIKLKTLIAKHLV